MASDLILAPTAILPADATREQVERFYCVAGQVVGHVRELAELNLAIATLQEVMRRAPEIARSKVDQQLERGRLNHRADCAEQEARIAEAEARRREAETRGRPVAPPACACAGHHAPAIPTAAPAPAPDPDLATLQRRLDSVLELKSRR